MNAKLKSEIERIRDELKQFLRDTLAAEHFDVIVPVAKKGLFLLRTAEIQGIQNYEIHLIPLEGTINLKGKKVLVLDNSATSGDTLFDVIQDLKKHHADEGNIKTAVFITRPQTKMPIQYKRYVEQGRKAEEITSLLKDYLSSLCDQLDEDHLVLTFRIKTSSQGSKVSEICSHMKTILKKYGNFRSLKTTARPEFLIFEC